MKARKTKSKILKLRDTSGVWIDDPSQIASMFVNDFSARFETAHQTAPNFQIDMVNSISTEDNDLLLQPVHESEIKEAVFQMDKFKAPRPDGFGAAFFQNHWHIVKEDVYAAIRSFFTKGKLLR